MRERLGWPQVPTERDPGSNGGAVAPGLGWPATEVSRETAAPASAEAASAEPASSETAPLDTPMAALAEQEVRRRAELAAGPMPAPVRTRVFAVANQKGGVGKTTTAVNIAAALAQAGQRVLLVDLDPQGNASTALDIEHSEGTPGVYQVLVEGVAMRDVVRDCAAFPALTVVPASIDLAGAEIDLVSLVARESRLRRALGAYLAEEEQGGRRFDYVFVDCPPSLGLLTVNALVAGEEILVPIQCEYYALEGVGQLLRTVEMVRAHLNPNLQVSTVVLTMHDARTRLSAGVAAEVRNHFGDQVLRTAIPRSVRISEAPSYQQTVLSYDPTSPGALSYLEAAREMAERAAPTTTGETSASGAEQGSVI